MNRSIFKKCSLKSDWLKKLYELTPIESVSDGEHTLLFKREDFFAPLGYGGINGSKLRQAIFLFNELGKDKKYVVGGMSVHSPQHLMMAVLSRYFGLKAIDVIGNLTSDKALKHPMIKGANDWGAEFAISKGNYNSNLQKKCRDIISELGEENSFYLEYGITLGLHHTPEEILEFHLIGAEQVKNIPDTVTDLVIAAGSCNSLTSVLLGLVLYPKKNLKHIHAIEVGPSKLDYVRRRLEMMGECLDRDLNVFSGLNCFDEALFSLSDSMYDFCYYPTFGSLWKYETEVPNSFSDIVFHPTYEGKVFEYLKTRLPELMNENTLFWIVGSEPKLEVVNKFIDSEKNELTLYGGV